MDILINFASIPMHRWCTEAVYGNRNKPHTAPTKGIDAMIRASVVRIYFCEVGSFQLEVIVLAYVASFNAAKLYTGCGIYLQSC